MEDDCWTGFMIVLAFISPLALPLTAVHAQSTTVTTTVTNTVTTYVTQTVNTTLTWTEYSKATTTITVESVTVRSTTSIYYLFQNFPGFPGEALVIFLGSGAVVGEAVQVGGLDEEVGFVLTLKRMGLDVAVPRYSQVRAPSFPLEVAAHLVETGRYERIYLVGWSAGGLAAAWSLIEDEEGVVDGAVIADTILKVEGGGDVLNPYRYAGEVRAPHLLVWGRTDEFAGVENASAWIENTTPALGSLEVYDYGHYWWNTGAEAEVSSSILSFLTGDHVKMLKVKDELGEHRIAVRCSSPLKDASYNPGEKLLTVSLETPQNHGGRCTIAVPVSLLEGEPAILVNGVERKGSWIIDPGVTYAMDSQAWEEEPYYVITFEYEEGESSILVGGSQTIPEYPVKNVFWALAVMFIMLLAFTRRRRHGGMSVGRGHPNPT